MQAERPASLDVRDAHEANAPIFPWRRGVAACEPAPVGVSHDFAVLGLCVAGGWRVHQRAAWNIERGDVLIVPAGEPHRRLGSGRSEMHGLGLFAPCFSDDSAALLEPFERVRAGASPVVRIPARRRPFMESLLEELGETTAAPHDAAVRLSLTTLILNEVSRATAPSTGATLERTIVGESLRYIERHCLEPLTVEQVAAAMRRTPSYLTTALGRATGRSALGWIIAGRMAEARRRLLHSDEHVDIIAERVGYADATHFIRLFRRAHGATPAAWRARQRPTSS